MTQEMPKFHETFNPILKVLEDSGEIHYRELYKLVTDRFYSDLSDEQRKLKTKSNGTPLIFDRIGWGKSYLKQGKFVEYPRRGYVLITDKGRVALAKGGVTQAELRADSDYVASEVAKGQAKLGDIPDQALDNMSPQDMIDQGFGIIEKDTKIELLDRLKKIDPFYFEKVILILLKKMGYGDFIETKKTGDGGIDGIINQDQLGLDKIFIQAKRYTENKVREKDIRNFIGAMSGDTTNGVFVTTSSFDDAAVIKAREAHHKIILVDGEKLVDLMYQYGVGVEVTNTYEIKQLDEDFFEDQ